VRRIGTVFRQNISAEAIDKKEELATSRTFATVKIILRIS
jgi:hypothetical protein